MIKKNIFCLKNQIIQIVTVYQPILNFIKVWILNNCEYSNKNNIKDEPFINDKFKDYYENFYS